MQKQYTTPQEFFTGKTGRGDWVRVGDGWAAWSRDEQGAVEFASHEVSGEALAETMAMLKVQSALQ